MMTAHPEHHNKKQSFRRTTDAERIYQAAKAAGEPAFGVVAVDVWLFQPHEGKFIHAAEGSTWICPAFAAQASGTQRLAVTRITDPRHPQYCQPRSQVMGAGLAGYFWSILAMKPDHHEGGSTSHMDVSDHSSELLWRDLQALTSDPFQPPYPRMKVLQEAGLGKATGVPFDMLGTKGVVLYLSRPEADEKVLNGMTNVHYLRAAAHYIATACALSKPCYDVGRLRRTRLATTWRRLTTRIKSSPNLRKQSSRISHQSEYRSSPEDSLWGRLQSSMWWHFQRAQHVVKARVSLLARKSRGSVSIVPPPPAPLRTCVWTFTGVLMTLSILQCLSQVDQTETGHGVLLAPFGALLTLQYSLTAAPASQPRNAVFGQSLCLVLAWFWSAVFALLSALPTPLLLPTSVASAIALMQKLGIPHPPAAAAMVAILTQSGGFTWNSAIWLWIGNITAIVTAILVNNLAEHRQYPIYWHFGLVPAWTAMVQRGDSLPRSSSSSLSGKPDKSVPVGDSPTVPSYYDSDGSFVRNGDEEDPGDDAPLQF